MSGLQPNLVRLESYDPNWPDLYENEAQTLRAALRSNCIQIEHIGSTAVAGLEAKPIIDVAVRTPTLANMPGIETILRGAGYLAKGEFGLPGRYFFTKGDPTIFHVHVVAMDSSHWDRWLKFRNALRADKSLRESYRALKLDLAAKFAADRPSYTAAKTEFITHAIEQNKPRRVNDV